MNCRKLSNDLSAYLDGSISVADRSTLEKHLASCPLCEKELTELKKVKFLLASLDKQPAKDTLAQIVTDRIKAGELYCGILESFISTAKASLIAAVMIFGIISLFSYFTPSMAATDNVEAMNNYVLKGNDFAKLHKISDAGIMKAMLE